jgi:hypothetical protein
VRALTNRYKLGSTGAAVRTPLGVVAQQSLPPVRSLTVAVKTWRAISRPTNCDHHVSPLERRWEDRSQFDSLLGDHPLVFGRAGRSGVASDLGEKTNTMSSPRTGGVPKVTRSNRPVRCTADPHDTLRTHRNTLRVGRTTSKARLDTRMACRLRGYINTTSSITIME